VLGRKGRLGLAGEELQHPPVAATLLDQTDDGLRAGHPYQLLAAVGGVDERHAAGALVHGQLHVLGDRDG